MGKESYMWMKYDIKGKGEPILWLPPFGYDGQVFKRATELLGQSYKHILIDFSGYSQREHSHGDPMEEIAEDLMTLLEVKGFHGVTVIGAGAGGYHSMDLGLLAPHLVKRLVLINTTYGGPNSIALPEEYMAKIFRAQMRKEEDLLSLLAMEVSEQVATVDEYLLKARVMFDSPQSFENYLLAIASFNISDRLWKIKQETLIVSGKKDQIFNPHNMLHIHQSISHSTFVTIDEGHLCFAVKADDFITPLQQFLDDNQGV